MASQKTLIQAKSFLLFCLTRFPVCCSATWLSHATTGLSGDDVIARGLKQCEFTSTSSADSDEILDTPHAWRSIYALASLATRFFFGVRMRCTTKSRSTRVIAVMSPTADIHVPCAFNVASWHVHSFRVLLLGSDVSSCSIQLSTFSHVSFAFFWFLFVNWICCRHTEKRVLVGIKLLLLADCTAFKSAADALKRAAVSTPYGLLRTGVDVKITCKISWPWSASFPSAAEISISPRSYGR